MFSRQPVPVQGLTVFKLDKLPDRHKDLEELALEKMKCTDLACIGAIEAQERAIGSDAKIRSLNGVKGAYVSQNTPRGETYVLPAPSTADQCKKAAHIERERLTKSQKAAIARDAGGELIGANLKEYEDMPLPAGGQGWPGVDSTTRQDTMEAKEGVLKYMNRV